MRKIVPLALASAIMSACTGTIDPGSSSSNDVTPSSSSQTTQSSTPPVSSSSVTTPSSSSTATNSSTPSTGTGLLYSNFSPNELAGATQYGTHCASCHGTNGVPKTLPGGDADTPLGAATFIDDPQSLFYRSHAEMPLGSTSDCENQCAADVTAYILTWVSTSASCDVNKAVGYSPRRLRLLTADEYQNTLEDLLGVDYDLRDDLLADGSKGGFPDNSTSNVDNNRADKYWNISESIADWAVENGQPFACTSGCIEQFVYTLLPRMFRRPLTPAEQSHYEDIFSSSSGEDAFKFALINALNSPQFLYRSEIGNQVAELLSTEPESYYRPDPTTLTTWDIGTPNADGFTRAQNYTSGQMPYTWTGNDVVSFSISIGKDNNGNFPGITFKANNKEYPIVITSDRPQTVRLRIEGAPPGNHYVDFSGGNNVPFFIGPITFGAAKLYTPERGDEAKMKLADPSSFMLDPYEYATLLSYTLTGTTPDDALYNAAANDGLHYEEQVRAHVERLINSPRGRERMGALAGYWFGTDDVIYAERDAALFPNYTDAVRESMAEEVRELFREIFYNNRPFESLYNGDFTVLNKTLSDYYGIASGSNGANDWNVVENLDKRGGILTTGAFMTTYAHPDKTAPIIRAVRIRERMLCQHISPPPLLDADREALLHKALEDEASGMATSRQYYETITDSVACYACHQYKINPLFGTEDFDQVGQWRDTQKGATGLNLPINNEGRLYGPDNINDESNFIPFNGAKDLSKAIADLPGTEACLIEKGFRFVAGMPLKVSAVDSAFEPPLNDEQKSDYACVADKAKASFTASNRSVKAMVTEMVMQDLMRYRKAK